MDLVVTVLASAALTIPYIAFGGYFYSVLTAKLSRTRNRRLITTALVSAAITLYLLFPVVAVVWLHQLVVLFVES